MEPARISRRRLLALLSGAAVAGVLPSCETGGHFTVLGYTTAPNYDCGIRTVRVPIFENRTFRQGVEFDLTRSVVRTIESRTPYKVVSHGNADTELTGKITAFQKNIVNINQVNEIREGEVVLTVELVWRDLRSNEVLSNPQKPVGVLPATELPRFGPEDPGTLPPPLAIDRPIPVVISYSGRYLPEVGESNASGQTAACNQLAKQIATMMEKNWQAPSRCP